MPSSNHSNESEDVEEDLLKDPPTDIDPYATLFIEVAATPAEIRTAYRKLALKHHPDKVTEEEKSSAHVQFQKIAFAYAILSDEKRRTRYDATGRTDDKDDGDPDFDWKAFYAELNEDLVTGSTLAEFKKTYQGSEEERNDLLAAYTRFNGDVNSIFENIMLSEPLADEDRFRKIIDTAIADEEVESYKAYTNETAASKKARRKNAEREGKEAMAYAKKLGVYDKLFGEDDGKKKKKNKKETNPEDDPTHPLAALIKSRQQSRGMSFLDNLEAKYAGGKKRQPTEEEFQETRKKVDRKRAKR